MFRSGNTVVKVIQHVSDAMVSDIQSTIAELDRISRVSNLDPNEMFSLGRSALEEHLCCVESSVRHGMIWDFPSEMELDERFPQIKDNVRFCLRQYQVGLFEFPQDQRSVKVNNQFHVDKMFGGAIQQGVVDSNQTNILSNEINVTAALDALTAIESSLKKASVPDEQLRQIQADISALRAQLERPEVSTGVVREIGQSLKKVSKGVAINVGSEAVTGAASKLWNALGIT